ncbi:methyltransferase [Aureococcus anophagefferens]|nr:methyltransferase [Aureococcus anophagefferens]
MEHHDAAFWDAEYASGALGERAFDWLFDFAELGEARWRCAAGPAGGRRRRAAPRAAVRVRRGAGLRHGVHGQLGDGHRGHARRAPGAGVGGPRRRDLPPLSFDAALDKACLDAVLCYADASAADACVASYARVAARRAARRLRVRASTAR